MIIKTARFGELDVGEQDIVEFNPGLLGFEKLTRYILMDIAEIPDFKWLQSIDEPNLAFLLVDPFTIKKSYCVELSDDVVNKLEIKEPEQVLVYTIVTVPKSGFKNATTNLVGPLIINWLRKKGKQIIFERDSNSIRYPLISNDSRKLNYGG
ncbi:MAG: flagellar assembly protein FliW [Syntrophomonadaceae bacterium]|nr:flagellar assembly protein FliW [Syntrophomonadaceae bacterium]